jgi:3-methyladenine DNA glycosylase Mpg
VDLPGGGCCWAVCLICGVAAGWQALAWVRAGTIAAGEAMMAQKVTVALEDDLTRGPANQTVRFALDGTDYEIDLSAKNAAAFGKRSRRS